MAADDWAIVVGVWLYPALDNLRGPENDAVAFAEWLRDPDGGNIRTKRKTQIQLILSSDFHPPFAGADVAKPTRDGIERAFDRLEREAQKSQKKNRGLRVGRRLYLYFAGHGFAPMLDEAALLTANATPSNLRYHVAGRAWANWFHKANYFDEIVLFMDCCQNSYSNSPINPVGYGDITGPKVGQRFFGFGTKWSKVSWERAMLDGKVHGVFTTALLNGLKGAAADPNTGIVNGKALREYLLNYMREFLSPEDRQNPDVSPEPDIPDLDNAGGLVFAQLTPPIFSVTLRLPATASGKTISIMDNKFVVVKSTAMPAGAVTPWKVQLKRGNYLAQVIGDGQGVPFDVSGSEPEPEGKTINL